MFARREAKTRIRQRDWLTLAGEKIRREQVGSVPNFLSVRANKFAEWKIGFKKIYFHKISRHILNSGNPSALVLRYSLIMVV